MQSLSVHPQQVFRQSEVDMSTTAMLCCCVGFLIYFWRLWSIMSPVKLGI